MSVPGREKASGGGGRERGQEQQDKKPVKVAQLLEEPDHFLSPASLFSAPLGSPSTKPPPRYTLVLCPLRRSRSNGLRTAVPHHTPRLAVQPTLRARRQKESAAPSAPRSFRRLPAPPAPQPLDCGRRKPLHERAPEQARPRTGPAAAQILATSAGVDVLSLQLLQWPAPR
ncbi:hypothetical protein mRhiFer1_008441 [Rhinolophus ferrumequinum]|uniref:Uncharacterized protein n=1 Tax=Rhinolophus ferrumequinum TaxID=59479 RepID=A0A7J7V847_RHIFE|nr:hypothetical protein mRhiFer1_008441 [Rhinolophus ferrumequinum]